MSEWTQRRAQVASLTRHRPNDPRTTELRRNLAADRLAAHIEKVVADAPPFTPEQTARLVAVIGGTR